MILFDRNAPLSFAESFSGGALKNLGGLGAYAYGRTALRAGLKAIGGLQGTRILLPGFLCRVAVEAVRESGAQPVFYPVNDHLEPDWQKLEHLCDSSTTGLMMVHYFGQPQNPEAFGDFCRRKKLLLIEDNAHGYGGRVEQGELGKLGDLSISSPRKSLPVLNGSLLWLKNREVPQPMDGEEKTFPGRKLLEQLLRSTIASSALYRKLRLSSCRYHLQNQHSEPALASWAMAASAGAYLRTLDLAEVKRKRRSIYALWQDWGHTHGLTPVFDKLHDGAIPLAYPACSNHPEGGHEFFKYGYLSGLDIHSWPDLDSEALQHRPEILSLWRRLVLFPIHHLMDEAQLRHRLETRPCKVPHSAHQ